MSFPTRGRKVLTTYSLRGQMQTIIEQLREAATEFATGIARMRITEIGNMQKMQDAATEVEKAATRAPGGTATPRQPATHVIVDKPAFKLGSLLWENPMGAIRDPASRPSQREWPPSCSSNHFKRRCWLPEHRWGLRRRNVRHDLDDRANRQHESSGRVHFAVVSRLAVGAWEMLLSIPIIVIVKVVSERVEALHPMAELLAD